MHTQNDLFRPMCGRQHQRQGELFDEANGADSDLRCTACREFLVRTASGYLCCPQGHGKLLTEAIEDDGPADAPEPWPDQARAIAKCHAERETWLWGRSRCICGACRLTRSRCRSARGL